MSLNSSMTTVMTHKIHNQSSSGWARPSLAPLLTLRTRRDLNCVNDSSQFIMPMINALVTLLSPYWLQRQANIRLLDLHRRRRRSWFQCAPHNPPPNHIIKERVYHIRSCGAPLTSLAPAPLLRGRCPRLTPFRVLF